MPLSRLLAVSVALKFATLLVAAAWERGARRGGGPNVRVFDGTNGRLRNSFLADDPSFTGGVSITARDLNADGRADIFSGPLWGGRSRLRVWDGRTAGLLGDFLAFAPDFDGGLSIG